MVQSALMAGRPLAYREGQAMTTQQRIAAACVVVGLHVALIGGFVIAQLHTPSPPPERTLTVSLISEAPANATPTPPQPVEQQPTPPTPTPPVKTPPPTLMASSRPTPSPMSAPPVERPVVNEAPSPPTPAAPSQPAAAASASSATTATAAPVSPPGLAAYLNNPQPTYPPAARRKRDQGTVRLRVQVGPDGKPIEVNLYKTSGYPELDDAALNVVKQRWKFVPATQSGRAVTAWVIIPILFAL